MKEDREMEPYDNALTSTANNILSQQSNTSKSGVFNFNSCTNVNNQH